jgi:hypothetical protein
VGQQNRIETVEANSQGLLAEIGRGVNHSVLAVA